MQQEQSSLFDLLLDESSPWEALEAEQQLQAIDILARLNRQRHHSQRRGGQG